MRTFDILMLVVGGLLLLAAIFLSPTHPQRDWRTNLIAAALLAVIVVIPLVTLIKNG